MTRTRVQRDARRGVTLLEVMSVATLCATMMTSSFVVLRSSYTAWQAHEADMECGSNAAAVLRHVVRNVRQCLGVSALSASSLTVTRADAASLTWDRSGTDVRFQVDAGGAQPVAGDIQNLTFEGYEADGTTLAADPADVQLVRVAVTTQQPAGGTRTISTYVWVRSW